VDAVDSGISDTAILLEKVGGRCSLAPGREIQSWCGN
jgi:hypothetical protein